MRRSSPLTLRNGRRGGRTTFEIMLLLALLGSIAAAVLPALRRAGLTDETARTADALVGVLRRARATAEARGEDVLVAVDVASGRYWTTIPARDGERVESGRLPLSPSIVLHATEQRVICRFVSGGAAFGAPVEIRDAAGNRRTLVTVDLATGEPDVVHR